MFARKGDGTWRFCQDYRGLNAITQRSVEPLPPVDQLVDETRGARFFTKLDLASADMQFRIREEDQFNTRPSAAPEPCSRGALRRSRASLRGRAESP